MGSQRVPWTNTGHERARVSVAFSASAAGHKLKPIILIPRKKPLKNFVPPKNVRVVYATSGTFNYSVINEAFIQGVLNHYMHIGDFKKLHLVIDQATCHTSKETQNCLAQHNIKVLYVPKRTSYLQPADISWMRTLKAAYHVRWNNWMMNEPHTVTAQGNIRSPDFF